MVTFSPCIRNLRADGYAKVYIRVTKDRIPDYMATSLIASKSQIDGTKIKDQFITTECLILIKDYVARVNKVDSTSWSTKDVIAYLERNSEEVSFTDYYQEFMDKMINEGRRTPAENYKFALKSFMTFCKDYKLAPVRKDYLNFSDITSQRLNAWIESLSTTRRAKNMYPNCIQTVFKAGLIHFNNYDNDDIRIKNMPFMKVEIPKTSKAKKRSTSRETLLKLFNADVSGATWERVRIAQDVALMSFCLAGMNVADLYYMEKDALIGRKLCYNRHKTRNTRDDEAYTEITIPDRIFHLFDKYKGEKRLLSFSDRVGREKTFLDDVVAKGLKEVAEIAGVSENITSYTFRHSFGTIAQNKCGASTELVGFALNHGSAHKITEGYIEKDYTPIDKLVKKVLTHVFGKEKK